MLTLVSISLTVTQDHSGSAKAKNQHWIILTTKQAISIKLATRVGHFLCDLDFENIYMAWLSSFSKWYPQCPYGAKLHAVFGDTDEFYLYITCIHQMDDARYLNRDLQRFACYPAMKIMHFCDLTQILLEICFQKQQCNYEDGIGSIVPTKNFLCKPDFEKCSR